MIPYDISPHRLTLAGSLLGLSLLLVGCSLPRDPGPREQSEDVDIWRPRPTAFGQFGIDPRAREIEQNLNVN